jgi:hypothetical protein
MDRRVGFLYFHSTMTNIKHFVIISWPGQVSFCGRFPSVICPYIHSPHILIFFLQMRSTQPDYNQAWKRWLMYEKIYTFIQIKLILHWEENLMLSKSLKKKPQKNSAFSQIEVLYYLLLTSILNWIDWLVFNANLSSISLSAISWHLKLDVLVLLVNTKMKGFLFLNSAIYNYIILPENPCNNVHVCFLLPFQSAKYSFRVISW